MMMTRKLIRHPYSVRMCRRLYGVPVLCAGCFLDYRRTYRLPSVALIYHCWFSLEN